MLLAKRRLEREMAAEMQAHLDGLAERNIAKGMTPEEARYAARREFGGVEQIKERARDARGWVWLEQLGQDVRYALRSLARSPAFTVTAVVTLALGIGVNAALFTLYNTIALQSVPVKDPASLVRIAGRTSQGLIKGGYSYAEYRAYREGGHTLEGLLATSGKRWTFQREGEVPAEPELDGSGPNAVWVSFVSDNYFEVLGETIPFGREIRPEEFRAGAPVIVLSHAFWQNYLQGDPRVLGTALRFDGQLYTVIGVASPTFSGEQAVTPAGWLPYTRLSSRPEDFTAKGLRAFSLIGRCKPGVTDEQAKADLDVVAAKWAAEFPEENAKTSVVLRRGLPVMESNPTPKGLIALGLLFFGFTMVLVIACTNVANLLFARGVSRQKEIAVRLAMGAGRWRIVRQLLTENALLCSFAAVVGLGLGVWTLQVILPKVIAAYAPPSLMLSLHPVPDLRVLGFTALLTIGATITAGLLPALHASRASFNAALHSDGAAFGGRLTPTRLRQLLLIAQVSICVMLLSCAGVLVRNLLSIQRTDRGFDAHAVFGVALRPSTPMQDQGAALQQALTATQALPGVAGCGLVSPTPFEGINGQRTRIQTTGTAVGGAIQDVQVTFMTGGLLDALGVPLRRGRTFGDIEQRAAARVILVSEALARRLWPGQDAVGKTLAVSEETWHRSERGWQDTGALRECEVIGVAADVAMQFGDDDTRVGIYLPYATERPMYGAPLLRPYSNTAAAREEIVRAAKARGVNLRFGRPLSDRIDQLEQALYGFALLGCALGGLALAMASVGLHGLMAFAVNQRVREIGVRMALGATAGGVVGLFVRQSMRLVAMGLGLGLIGAGFFALLLEKVLFGFKGAFDPVAFGVVALLFASIALFACWLPARRAAKVDPMVALRAE